MSDYDSPLTGEVLSDVAQTFFGSRRKLDDMIDILRRYADTLAEKGELVQRQAGLLHFLLVEESIVARFYEAIGVDDPGELAGCRPPDPIPRRRIPFALTARGRFVKTVTACYRRLEKTCREYRCSSANPLVDAESAEDACVDVRLVQAMWELINDKIRQINEESSPSSVLQYAKGFDARGEKRSAVAGATAGEYAGMDQKYGYRPIPVEQLRLKRFPELPVPERCLGRIERFCAQVYPQIADKVHLRLLRLKEADRSL